MLFRSIGKNFGKRVAKSLSHFMARYGRKFLVFDSVRVKIDKCLVGALHGVTVLAEEVGVKAAKGMQFHAGNQFSAGILLFNRLQSGAQLRR